MTKQISKPYQVKGPAIRNLKNYINQLVSDGYFEKLAEEAGFANSKLIMPSSWYPADTFINMQDSAAKQAGLPVEKLYSESASFILEQDLLGIYKFFIRVSGASNVLGKLPQIVSTYTNFIIAEVVENRDTVFVIKSAMPSKYHHWYKTSMTAAFHSLMKICKRQLQACDFEESRVEDSIASDLVISVATLHYS